MIGTSPSAEASRSIRKVLVANRGEIALRIMRTLRSMGISSVAVYSDVDANMPFARYADEAVLIGPATASESYLIPDRILDAARSVGADAIHPGYGFLSENAAFAEAVELAGMAFIGPRPNSIRTMGDKLSAKEAVALQNVPLVPGSDGEVTNLDDAENLAKTIGFPIMVKASAGGGGKGMRVVHDPARLREETERAMSEAQSAFGNGLCSWKGLSLSHDTLKSKCSATPMATVSICLSGNAASNVDIRKSWKKHPAHCLDLLLRPNGPLRLGLCQSMRLRWCRNCRILGRC